MHHAERGIAVAHFRHQDAHRTHVVDLAERDLLALHLAPDGIDVFRAPGDIGLHAHAPQHVFQRGDDILDVLVAVEPLFVQQLRDVLVGLGLEIAEGQVLQLPLDVADAEPVRQRRVDVENLAGHALPALGTGVLDITDCP